MDMKHCPRCGETKAPTEFNAARASRDGLQPRCRPCDNALNAEWRAKNKERRRAYDNSPQMRDKRRAYKKANPGVLSLSDHRRRERVRSVPLTADEKRQIKAIYEQRDQLNAWSGRRFEVDHIQPLARGGIHHPNNLQLLAAAENRRKGAKPLQEVCHV